MIIKVVIVFMIIFFSNLSMILSKDYEQYLFELNIDEPDENFIEIFEYYRDFPIDLKSTTAFNLSRLPDISFGLAEDLLNDIKNNAEWSEIKKKQKLTGFQVYIIESCTNVIEKDKKFNLDYRTRFNYNLEDKNGILNDRFKGDKVDLYNRLSLGFDNLSVNLIVNKDEGEVSYADDYSGNIAYNYKNHKVILGDYRTHLGLGLLINTGFPIRKSANPSDALINLGNGFSPSRNMLALGHLRGVAYQSDFLLDKIRIKPKIFYSNFNRAATINNDNQVTSFHLTNLFRTDNEIEKKNALNEQLIGSSVELNYKNFTFGVNQLSYLYDKELTSNSNNYYNGFKGNNYSSYLLFNHNNHLFSSEIAIDNNNNVSTYSIYNFKANNFEYGVSHRFLHKNSRLQFNNVLTNYSTNSNEQGILTHFSFFENKYRNSVYLDIYERPGIDFFTGMPQSGVEIFDEFNYKINSDYSFLIRLRYKNQKEIRRGGVPRYYDRERIDFRQEFRIEKNVSIRFRSDIVLTEHSENRYSGFGYLLFGEISKSFFKSNNNSIRLSYYNSDSFEEAIWHFEYLLRGYLLAPPLYGEGVKVIARSQFKVFGHFLLSFAYTYEKRFNANSLGSGLDLILGNERNRVFLQLDYNY
jgi:hypothetical protein